MNENYEQHLADDYDKNLHVLRVNVEPERVDQPAESLTYEIIPTGEDSGVLTMRWDSLRVSLPIRSL